MDIARTVNRALLKGAVQQGITCKISGVVLDMKTAVSVTITGPSGSVGSAVYDGPVYDSTIAPSVKRMTGMGYTFEIIDGRTL